MKSRIFSLLLLLSLFLPSLNSMEVDFIQQPVGKPRVIVEKYKYDDPFRMDDESIWFIRSPPFDSQTWTEWWYSEEHIQPHPKYYFDLDTWGENPTVQVFEYTWDASIAKELFPEREWLVELLSEYPFLIQNMETGETLFAKNFSEKELAEFLRKREESRLLMMQWQLLQMQQQQIDDILEIS